MVGPRLGRDTVCHPQRSTARILSPVGGLCQALHLVGDPMGSHRHQNSCTTTQPSSPIPNPKFTPRGAFRTRDRSMDSLLLEPVEPSGHLAQPVPTHTNGYGSLRVLEVIRPRKNIIKH